MSAGRADKGSPERLDSWKAIAAYLKRDVTTVQRWERREGMPVHRHVHDKRGSVYALSTELDAWRQGRVLDAPEAAAGGDRRSRALLLSVAAVLVLSVAAFMLYRAGSPPRITSLAVLPLQNLSGDPSQEYLADGMTEALIGRLARIHDLRVISHTSVRRFKNAQMSAAEIGRILGVDAIVEGSVTRAGNRIRVTARLIRAAKDQDFWSETYERELQDVLGLQSELAQAIADRVEVSVSGVERQRLSSARSVAPEVYENYLKGEFGLGRARDKDSLEQSMGYFQQALRLDPSFAPAHLGVAEAFRDLGTVFMGVSPEQTRPEVVREARRALQLDPDLAEAHALLANVAQQQWHWMEARLEYQRALDLNPNDAGTHTDFALWLACQARTDEAVSWVNRGRQLDPLTVSGNSVAWILFLAHRYDEAVRELRTVLDVQPDSGPALTTLGFVLSAAGRDAEAVPVLERVVAATRGSPAATGVLIRAYARSGRRADALRLLADLKRRAAAGYIPAAAFVNAYLGLDDHDASFVWLEQAFHEQSNILQFLKVHPYFDPIRGDPRFASLVSRVWQDAD